MNNTTKRIGLVCSFGLLLTLAACGGDGTKDLTTAQFRQQANTICTQASQEIFKTVTSVMGGNEPTAAELQAGPDKIVAISTKQLDDIAALDAPSGLDHDVAALVAEGRKATAAAETQGPAYWSTDDNPWARTQQMATKLGLDACGSDE
jgi:hypothetical protein